MVSGMVGPLVRAAPVLVLLPALDCSVAVLERQFGATAVQRDYTCVGIMLRAFGRGMHVEQNK